MTHSEILQLSSALLNDTARDKFTDAVLLPYYNIARMNLEEIFELNDIPVTAETSAVLAVPLNTGTINYLTTPALPIDLIEIKQLWESQTGQNAWVPVTRIPYLTPVSIGNTQITSFGVWAWIDQEIRVVPSSAAIDLKIDYVKYLFTMLGIGDLNFNNDISNTSSFLNFQLAALASEFIDENTSRANSLYGKAGASLQTSLGISIKGMQVMTTRRRPFRASFKMRRSMI